MSRMNRTLIVSLILLHVVVSGTRISQEKCAEYRKMFKAPQYHDGEDAVPKEFPFMAKITNGTHYINGILISETFVLTSVHNDYVNAVIVLGDLDVWTDSDDAQPKTYKVNETFIHPDFDRAYAFGDIRLYKLNESIEISEYMRPACLSLNDLSVSKDLTLIGWGATNIRNNKILHKITLHYMSDKRCKNAFSIAGRQKYVRYIEKETFFCAESARDSRRMVSNLGHAVIHDDRYGLDEVIGFSVDILQTEEANVTVFTRVSAYIDWIESIVWPGESTRSKDTQVNANASTSTATQANGTETKTLPTKYIYLIIVAVLLTLIMSASIACCLLFNGKTRQNTVRFQLNQNNNTLNFESYLQ